MTVLHAFILVEPWVFTALVITGKCLVCIPLLSVTFALVVYKVWIIVYFNNSNRSTVLYRHTSSCLSSAFMTVLHAFILVEPWVFTALVITGKCLVCIPLLSVTFALVVYKVWIIVYFNNSDRSTVLYWHISRGSTSFSVNPIVLATFLMSHKQLILVRRRIPVAGACIRIIIRIINGRFVFHAFILIHKVKFAAFVVRAEEVLFIWAILPIFLANVVHIIRVPNLWL